MFYELYENFDRIINKNDYNFVGGKIGVYDNVILMENRWYG